jgi:acyl-coenzyme A synthetase/AMP-(fatty) acid ligase
MDHRESEVIKAIVAVTDEHHRLRRDVIQHCRQFLAEYKIPRAIEFVAEIPVDVTGKQLVAWGPVSDELSDKSN